MRTAIIAAALFVTSCASSPRPDPTPLHPLIGCIAATMNQQARVAGKIIPEPVRIIGEYEHDSDQWMVVRGVYDAKDCVDVWNRERCRWEPMAKGEVRIIGCGAETTAMLDARFR